MATINQGIRRGRTRAIAGLLAPLTRTAFGRRGFGDGILLNQWAAVVGPDLAAHTCPEKVIYPTGKRGDGTLHLKVEGSGLALELQHLIPQLIERVNACFGYRAVAHVRIVQGPVPQRPAPPARPARPLDRAEEERLDARLAAVDDPELRATLERLGRAVAGRRG